MGLKNYVKKLLKQPVRRSPKMRSAPDCLSGVIAYNRYGGYCVPLASVHRAACQTVMRGQVWEDDTIAFICQHADGDIVHAGTYFGDFLPALSKAARDHQVWAFEPAPENYRCADITVRLNDLGNVHLLNAALGSSETELRFKTVDDTGRPLGGWCHASATGSTCVPQLVLDKVIPAERKVALVHLDVEFFERDVLNGARELLRRDRPIVILENVPEGFAEEFGYTFDRKIDANSVFRPLPVPGS